MSYDVAIVGGGPAGSTLASLLLRHRPALRVIIVERERFPRFHVGETLVSEINRVLHEMGAYDAIDGAGFVRKLGATFRWGATPEPWHMLFATMDELRPEDERQGVQTAYTWHVDRARYDEILLDHARSLGAAVRHATVERVRLTGDHAVGLTLDDGTSVEAHWAVDATGQRGLEGSIADREPDPHLRNVAYWGYFRGFHLEPALTGTLDASRAFIVAHPRGWSWHFPIRPDLVSVGVVTTLEGHRQREERQPEAFLRAAIAECPELRELLVDAKLEPYQPGAPLVHRISDFSYVSRSIVQPGLLRVGDAAGFVDPILSVGCYLGQSGARFLAYTLLELLRDPPAFDQKTLLDSYAEHVRETLGAFRQLTYFFYRFNERKDAWWAEARRLVENAGFPRHASDHQAFTAFACGFAARRSVFRETTGQFDESFFFDAFQRLIDPDRQHAVTPRVTPDDVLALAGPVTMARRAVPVEGAGRMIEALRVEVAGGALQDADTPFVRRMLIPPSLAPLFGLMDGRRDVRALGTAVADRLNVAAEHRSAVGRYVNTVALGLVERGLAVALSRPQF